MRSGIPEVALFVLVDPGNKFPVTANRFAGILANKPVTVMIQPLGEICWERFSVFVLVAVVNGRLRDFVPVTGFDRPLTDPAGFVKARFTSQFRRLILISIAPFMQSKNQLCRI